MQLFVPLSLANVLCLVLQAAPEAAGSPRTPGASPEKADKAGETAMASYEADVTRVILDLQSQLESTRSAKVALLQPAAADAAAAAAQSCH
jgi:hypothetical protein